MAKPRLKPTLTLAKLEDTLLFVRAALGAINQDLGRKPTIEVRRHAGKALVRLNSLYDTK